MILNYIYILYLYYLCVDNVVVITFYSGTYNFVKIVRSDEVNVCVWLMIVFMNIETVKYMFHRIVDFKYKL